MMFQHLCSKLKFLDEKCTKLTMALYCKGIDSLFRLKGSQVSLQFVIMNTKNMQHKTVRIWLFWNDTHHVLNRNHALFVVNKQSLYSITECEVRS